MSDISINEFDEFSFKVKNIKCFGDEESGFEKIYPINLIIGKNNSGKSTLLDAINHLCSNKIEIQSLGYQQNKVPELLFENRLSENLLNKIFHQNHSGGSIGINHWDFGKKWIGKTIKWKIINGIREFVLIDPSFGIQNMQDYENGLIKHINIPFQDKIFKRLQPDRNIKAENQSEEKIDFHGNQATNYISKYLTRSTLSDELIKKIILNELNDIFNPDSNFKSIETKQHEDGKWEIYLTEENKGRIALSQSGSGLKTILLVLVYLYLIPDIEKKELKDYVFGFEELENNLHPSLQRRLFTYLKRIAIEENCTFFLTTHSNVIIDLFFNDEHAQIIHVKYDGEKSTAKKAISYNEHKDILDDLEIRASDLLQSNSIVWVEGPSDRIYFNKWIELFGEGKLIEGIHYQCIFYGGKLLSRLSSEDPDIDESDLVNILKVNRNAIFIIDSDKKKPNEEINKSKKRIVKEVIDNGGMAWVTDGKEIENYIPSEAIKTSLSIEKDLIQIEKYENISEYLKKYSNLDGGKFSNKKVFYAEKFISGFTKENLSTILDLQSKILESIEKIKGWNGNKD